LRVRGKRGGSLWRFDFGQNPSTKVVEGEIRTLETLSTIFRGIDQNL